MKRAKRQTEKLWTGREVVVTYAGNLSKAKDARDRECRPGRHRLHWTKTEFYVCNDCSALFSPTVPDENLGPDATRLALGRAAMRATEERRRRRRRR